MESGVVEAVKDRTDLNLEFSFLRGLKILSSLALRGEGGLPLFLPSSCGQTQSFERLAQWLQGFAELLLIAVASPPKQRILSLRQGSHAIVVCFFLFGEEGEAEKDCGVLTLMESMHTSSHLFPFPLDSKRDWST